MLSKTNNENESLLEAVLTFVRNSNLETQSFKLAYFQRNLAKDDIVLKLLVDANNSRTPAGPTDLGINCSTVFLTSRILSIENARRVESE